MKPKYIVYFFGIILLATFFRFYLIKEMPGGLFPDEAANGLDINLMEQGVLQPFYERGNGREALFFYLLWGAVRLLGRGAWQHHVVSALIGVLSVIACFFVTKALFSTNYRRLTVKPSEKDPNLPESYSQILGFKKSESGSFEKDKAKLKLGSLASSVLESKATILALLASFLMATSAWHVVLSRTAFRANLITLISPLVFYFGLKIFGDNEEVKKYRWAMLFGLFFGLGFYTYIAFRIMVPILGMLVLWPLIADFIEKPRFQGAKKYIADAIIAIIFFFIAFAPLGYYFYTHPGSFVGRSGQVSVFNEELNGGDLVGTILEVTRVSLLGYFFDGDLNWRHNISGEPFLSIIISPFFALGLLLVTILAIRYFIRPIKYASDFKHFLLAGWFYGLLLPVITTAEGIPHGLRSIGTIPVVFIITAYGLYMFVVWMTKLFDIVSIKMSNAQINVVKLGMGLLSIAFFVSIPVQTYRLYFIHAYNSPENFYAFRSDLTPVTEYLIVNGKKEDTYLILDKFSVQTMDYLTTKFPKNPSAPENQPYTQVDPEDSWQDELARKDGKPIWPHGLKPGDKVVFTQSSIYDIKNFKLRHLNSRLIKEVRNKFGQAVLAVYEIY